MGLSTRGLFGQDAAGPTGLSSAERGLLGPFGGIRRGGSVSGPVVTIPPTPAVFDPVPGAPGSPGIARSAPDAPILTATRIYPEPLTFGTTPVTEAAEPPKLSAALLLAALGVLVAVMWR